VFFVLLPGCFREADTFWFWFWFWLAGCVPNLTRAISSTERGGSKLSAGDQDKQKIQIERRCSTIASGLQVLAWQIPRDKKLFFVF
jgi:hypothetical protein